MLFVLVVLWTGIAGASSGDAPAVLVWGDSLSAAYGIPAEKGWVQLLQQRLRERGYPHRVVNGSISGETTAGGRARLPAALAQHRPALVLIELGGNDGLRALPVDQLRANLRAMAAQARQAKAQALLFEMQLPPNYGAAYTQAFTRAFGEAAKAEHARLVPFFLASIGNAMDWFQDDGIHPSVAAQPRLLEAAWPQVEAALKVKR